jgi:hypothetical protein
MGYAFYLRFDAASEAAVAALWQALVDSGAGDGMQRLGHPPHLSLAVLDEEPPPTVVEAALDAVADLAGFGVQLGEVKRFPNTPIVWLAAEGGSALADLHARLLSCLPEALVWEHYRLGQWTPHVALQMQGDAVTAMAVAEAEWPALVSARVVALELVQFPPVVVLKSLRLR